MSQDNLFSALDAGLVCSTQHEGSTDTTPRYSTRIIKKKLAVLVAQSNLSRTGDIVNVSYSYMPLQQAIVHSNAAVCIHVCMYVCSLEMMRGSVEAILQCDGRNVAFMSWEEVLNGLHFSISEYTQGQ